MLSPLSLLKSPATESRAAGRAGTNLQLPLVWICFPVELALGCSSHPQWLLAPGHCPKGLGSAYSTAHPIAHPTHSPAGTGIPWEFSTMPSVGSR